MPKKTKRTKCIKCSSERILEIDAQQRDSFFMRFKNTKREYDGYQPGDIGLGSDEDSVRFKYCMDCGQIQGKFPRKPCRVEKLKSPPKNGDCYSDEDLEDGPVPVNSWLG